MTHNALRRVLETDELMQTYFAQPIPIGDASLMHCPEWDDVTVALVDRVPAGAVATTLDRIVATCRDLQATSRIRLTPRSACAWRTHLADRGFQPTGENRVYWIAPDGLRLPENHDVDIRIVASDDDADRFAAVQSAGFSVPAELQAWDRTLVKRHARLSDERFYIGSHGGADVAVLAGRCCPGQVTALWGLATLPAARGLGIGTAVLARALADAVRESDLIYFTTAWSNPVERLYSRLGFTRLAETVTFQASPP